MLTSRRIRYFLWACSRALSRDRACPFCGNNGTILIRRKKIVTALMECRDCGLRFRMPKDNVGASARFYQRDYSQGFTTDLPSEAELAILLEKKFRGSPKDYTAYIEVLKALGLRPRDPILDFGCSWGYGSWQLREAGFRVYSYEISQPRSQYAVSRLGCQMLDDPSSAPEPVKCFFSAHVIEHLPDPNVMWKAIDRILSSGGFVVCFTANGEHSREGKLGSTYHQLWGLVHPLLLTRRALQNMSKRNRFKPLVFCSPYSADEIRQGVEPGKLTGDELLLIGRRD